MHGLVSKTQEVAARFLRDRSGATVVEYGLICALIFLAVVGAIKGFGNAMMNLYTNFSTTINNNI